jgi:hypothetical protein
MLINVMLKLHFWGKIISFFRILPAEQHDKAFSAQIMQLSIECCCQLQITAPGGRTSSS